MLRAWMELIQISVAQSAIEHPRPRQGLTDQPRVVVSASEALDRASQKSQITLAVDSG
jgi:hypothetical protein